MSWWKQQRSREYRTSRRVSARVGRVSIDLLQKASSSLSLAVNFISFPSWAIDDNCDGGWRATLFQSVRRRERKWLSLVAVWKSCSRRKRAASSAVSNLSRQAARRSRALIFRSGWPDSHRLHMRNGQSSEKESWWMSSWFVGHERGWEFSLCTVSPLCPVHTNITFSPLLRFFILAEFPATVISKVLCVCFVLRRWLETWHLCCLFWGDLTHMCARVLWRNYRSVLIWFLFLASSCPAVKLVYLHPLTWHFQKPLQKSVKAPSFITPHVRWNLQCQEFKVHVGGQKGEFLSWQQQTNPAALRLKSIQRNAMQTLLGMRAQFHALLRLEMH